MRSAPVPPPVPQRPLINLLGAANTPPDAGRWQDGSSYVSDGFGAVVVRDTCSANAVTVREASDAGGLQAARAVYAEVVFDCTTLGGNDDDEQRVRAILDAELPRAVEHEFWTGELSTAASLDNPSLVGIATDVTPTPGTPVKPTAALGLLQRALADVYSGIGLLHVTRLGEPFVPALTRGGRTLETRVGNRVVPGVGYPGTGPDGDPAPDDAEWVYITPMVTVRIGTPELVNRQREVIDTAVNRSQLVARQPFETSIDGEVAFAVLMQTQVE